MKVEIRNTVPSEAEVLSQIQKAAFKPLYDKYHDEGNPYLRGSDDVLSRLNKDNRYFTILYDDKIVGGIFYRLSGKKSPTEELNDGEYYLARIYIHPDYQGLGIAHTGILLCENEFPDAETYYVDFPIDLDKNRRCYESVGFHDTSEIVRWGNGPVLAMHKKSVTEKSSSDNIKSPMVYEIDDELSNCLDVIHKSFKTVADEFGLNIKNCPKHTSFISLCNLEAQKSWGWKMFGMYAGKKMIGYMSLSKESDSTFELHNLAILPEYRHKGFGKVLLDYAKKLVQSLNGTVIKIGIVEESTVLKEWYISNGFDHICTKKFDHLPFTSGYLEWKVNNNDIL